MIIILHVLIIFAFSIFAGYGIWEFICLVNKPEMKKEIYLIIPILGYICSQTMFYYWYYFFEISTVSFYMTVVTLVLINYIVILLKYRRTKINFNGFREFLKNSDIKLLVVLLSIFLICAWQYVLIGEGYYYHSGNDDFFDAVRGGEEFLANTPLKYHHFDLSGYIKYDAIIRYQYSSQAFFRLLLGVEGVDGFMLQSILNLLLTSISVYWLTFYVFKSTKMTALFASFFSVSASFYFVTYCSGHVGSMIYVSIAPTFLGLFLLWIRKEIHWSWVFLLWLFYYFVENTYPGPIGYLALPAAVVAAYIYIIKPFNLIEKTFVFFNIEKNADNRIDLKKVNKVKIVLVSLIFFLLVYISFLWLWDWLEPRRVVSILRTNVSWKITVFKEMFMVFWGIYPPGSTGTASLLPLFITDAIINTIALILALVVSCFSVYAAVKSCKTETRIFLIIYAPFFIMYLIVMRYFWHSPYYFYKFLYLHFFLIIIILLMGLFENYKKWSKWIRRIFLIGFILLGTLNVFWDIIVGIDFYTRSYHDKKKIDDFFSKVPKNMIVNSYLNIPNEINFFVFGRILFDHGIYAKRLLEESKYVINVNKVGHAIYNSISKSKIIFDNGLLSVTETPKVNSLRLFTSYEPYNYENINLNWVGNELSIKQELYKNYISELFDYLIRMNMGDSTYIDIKDIDIYKLFYNYSKQKGISLQSNPSKAKWFIQSGYGPIFYEYTKDQKIVWKNDFFSIKYIPFTQRKLFSEYYTKAFNFSKLLSYIKSNGASVYLDMPESEYVCQYLRNMFHLNNVFVTSNPEKTQFFLRLVLMPPYEKYNRYRVTNPKERKVENLDDNPHPYKTDNWSLELFDIPYENRAISDSLNVIPVPYRVLTSNNESDFSVEISNVTEEAKYLRIFIEPGPSIDNSDFILNVSNRNGVEKKYFISSVQTVFNLPLSEFKNSISDSTLSLDFVGENLKGEKLIGKSLLPAEERFLNYVIWGIELTDNINFYSKSLIDVLNHKPFVSGNIIDRIFGKKKITDIININQTNYLTLGSGWYVLEIMNEKSFRWVESRPAEIILTNIDREHSLVHVDLEPGPGCGEKPLGLKIYNKDELIKEEVISGRQNVEVQLPKEIYKNKKEQIILKLVPETENVKIASDPRVLNFRVFNISLKEKFPQQKTIVDNMNFDQMSLGNGWYPYETYNGESFQWVGKKPAEIILEDIDDEQNFVQFNLEPGPGCGGKPLKLKVYNKELLLKEEIIAGRKNIEVQLPEKIYKNNHEKIILKLVTVTKNEKIAFDPRILNYRVFNISLKGIGSLLKTIVDKAYLNTINLGNGWYPYEIYDSKSFQWVGKKPAEIIFKYSDNNLGTLRINLEPGPSCGGEPLNLNVYLNDKLISKNKLPKRKNFEIDLKNYANDLKYGNNIIKLVPSSKNINVPGDSRTLNFRVFNINYIQQ